MTRKAGYLAVPLVAAVLLVSSCDAFFTSTWGKARTYETSNIKLDAGNVDDWIDKSVGNPELAKTLTGKIREELKEVAQGSPTKDQAKLQNAGIKLAVEAAGMGTSLVKNMDKLSDLLKSDSSKTADDTTKSLKSVLSGIQNDFNNGPGKEAATNVSEIAGGSMQSSISTYQNGGTPKFGTSSGGNNEYTDTADPADVGQVVVVLAMAVFGTDTIDNISLDDLNQNKYHLKVNTEGADKGLMGVTKNASAEEVALAAYLNLIATSTAKSFKENTLTKEIGNAFKVGNNNSN